jgi:hypothetical protein
MPFTTLIAVIWSYFNSSLFLTSNTTSTINYITGNVFRLFKQFSSLHYFQSKNIKYSMSLLMPTANHNVEEILSRFQNVALENSDLLFNHYVITFLFFISAGIQLLKLFVLTCARHLSPLGHKEPTWKEPDENRFTYGGGFGFTMLEPRTWKDFTLFMLRTTTRALSNAASGSNAAPAGPKPPNKPTRPVVPVEAVAPTPPPAVPQAPSTGHLNGVHANPVPSCGTPSINNTSNINIKVTPSAVVATVMVASAIAAWNTDPGAVMSRVNELTAIFGNGVGYGLGEWSGDNPAKVAGILDATQNTPTGQASIEKLGTTIGNTGADAVVNKVSDALWAPVDAFNDAVDRITDLTCNENNNPKTTK